MRFNRLPWFYRTSYNMRPWQALKNLPVEIIVTLKRIQIATYIFVDIEKIQQSQYREIKKLRRLIQREQMRNNRIILEEGQTPEDFYELPRGEE